MESEIILQKKYHHGHKRTISSKMKSTIAQSNCQRRLLLVSGNVRLPLRKVSLQLVFG